MRLAWLTDIHLDFLQDWQRAGFLADLRSANPDAVLITGDIADAPSVARTLREMATALHQPIYFVLGNHDFYRGSIPAVREQMRALCRTVPGLVYLSQTDAVRLTDATTLVGHDGWGDGRYGQYGRSLISLNDHLLIEELTALDRPTLLDRLQRLGDEAAAHLRRVLPRALASSRRTLLLTHVPPFRESCWYEGRTSDDEWAPFFACKAVGDVLLEVMPAYSEHHLTVLCGHTHSPGRAQILPNLLVWTGRAEYGAPVLQSIIDVP
jgi:3',5'-cyclic AMP phosphodiesterase CpdA